MLSSMKDIVNKIIEKIKINGKDSILLDSDDSVCFDIKEENFSYISKIGSEKTIAFVDGGNLEILKTPSLSLFFNRIYYTTYKKNRRCCNKLYEFFSLISAEGRENRVSFKCECFFTKNKLPVKEFYFDSFDPSLVKGGKRAEISSVGDVVRRLAELSAAKEADSDFIMIDGTLEAIYPHEKDIIDSIKTPLFGLSKTTSVLTKNGNSAVAALTKFEKKKEWVYHIGRIDGKNHNAELYFLKLNKNSDYILRFEAKKDDDSDIVISLLAEKSKDPIFLGYPYGFIEADKFARVSKKEKEALQLQLMVLLGKEGEKVKPYLNALNAHDILDSIS
jgi:hypothetical protein